MCRRCAGRNGLWLAASLALTAAARAGTGAETKVEVREEPGRVRITVGGEPLATYVYRDESIPRPYFAHLHAPGGVPVSRNHPPVAGKDPTDHAALHPGLWLAFGDLSGADSWRNRARVVHEAFVTPPEGNAGRGTFTVRNRYETAKGDAALCHEVCRYTVLVRPAGTLLMAESEFSADLDEFTFGDQEEMGFGVRVATPLTVKSGGRIVNAEGDRDERGVRGKASDWCDYSGTVDGRRVGVTLMTDPGNFRRSWFHARDYGLLVANPFGCKALTKGPESRVVVKKGTPFRLGFAVLLHASPAEKDVDLAAAYRDYREQIERRVSMGAPGTKVELVERALSPSAVTDLGGFVGRRVRASREGSLKPFDIDKYVAMFERPKYRDWFWVGEQAGKWLESAVWSSGQASDRALEAKARDVLGRLERAQEPSGYLGITDPAVRTPEKPLRGMDAYELYFVLHGLLTASKEWDNPAALTAARRLGDYFVDHVGPGKAEFWPSAYRPPANRNLVLGRRAIGVPPDSPRAPKRVPHSEIAGHAIHYGWEGSLLIDPMLRLYQATGDSRYLEWSRWVLASLDRWSGWDSFSKLDGVADGTLGLHQLQPYAHVHTFQMNFLGMLRLYEVTGDASLLRKVQGAWDDTVRRQMYITGGVGVDEHYEPGVHKPVSGDVAETCASMSWLQLNQALLELTGDPKYADVIERLLWNHAFASQTVDGDSHRYHTPPNGEKPRRYYHGPDCCTASGHRLVAMLPSVIVAEGKDGLFINQFVPSTARLRLGDGTAVTLTQETRYPEGEAVTVVVRPERPSRFALRLRVPAWCADGSVTINGETLPSPSPEVRAGTYLTSDRVWNPGDRVELRLPMRLSWVRSDGGETDPPAPPDERRWALTRGPVVFALDTVLWTGQTPPKGIGQEITVAPEAEPRYEAIALPDGSLGPGLSVPVTLADGTRANAPAWPFANVGAWYRAGEPRPERDRAAFSYAVWLMGRGAARTREAR
jgi:DUF1680 family protein